MTMTRFYRQLRALTLRHGTTWGVVTKRIGSLLRTAREPQMCPLVYVACHKWRKDANSIYIADVGRKLGLRPHDTERIVRAADGKGHPLVRARLSRACGL